MEYIKKNYDKIYLLVALLFLMIDIATTNELIEGITFLVIVVGFFVFVIPKKHTITDERIINLRSISGNIAFLLSTIYILLFMSADRYLDFSYSYYDSLRYLVIAMYITYMIAYTTIKRKI
ncbi:hypothetical protein CI105_08625 [Candidatus Izimaplasma bacterium ZiA1]|uniref:hypothetical protein n=1 Tax=Candidatus Izimoplasma sp. ZiA1 TaxID=2024899 RepID=UPI000BAA642A|nr:hypothetical protein CI105_08625 [Candidatus Izimaplasma bacterium ZiA1]